MRFRWMVGIGAVILFLALATLWYSSAFLPMVPPESPLLDTDESPVSEESRICTTEYDPVCGEDGITYSNACRADAAGVTLAHAGSCEE